MREGKTKRPGKRETKTKTERIKERKERKEKKKSRQQDRQLDRPKKKIYIYKKEKYERQIYTAMFFVFVSPSQFL